MQHFQRRCNREERVFSNSPSKHPAQLACLRSFAPTLSTWRILSPVFSGGYPEASYAQNKKAKVRERGAAEICPLHCSQIVCAFAVLFFFFPFTLFSSFYPLFTLILFLSFLFSPSASKWHVSIDCSSNWFACVWPPSFSTAIHRQCWCRMPGSWRADIRETVTRGCALIDFPLEWIKSASG